MSRLSKTEQDEAKATLREYLPQGATLSLVLQSVSRSGMSRVIKCLAPDSSGQLFDISWHVGRAVECPITDYPFRGVRISGCGMDMGLALADMLSYALYGVSVDQTPLHHPATGNGIRCKWL